ncbi:hypothetical protein JL720_15174 [Aureococcus anophagefferens]|nr:hypothetical protein JL720_15174 [Aureococcus anophagefferens]
MDGAVGQRIQQKLATRRLASGENDAHAATKAAEKLHRRLARLAEKLEMSELATSEASSHVAELMKRGAGARRPRRRPPPSAGGREAKTTAWIRFAAEELALEVAAKAAEPDDHRACCAVLQDALAVRRGLAGFRRATRGCSTSQRRGPAASVAQNPRLRLAAGCLGDADGPPPPPRLDFTFGCGCAPAFELPDFGLPGGNQGSNARLRSVLRRTWLSPRRGLGYRFFSDSTGCCADERDVVVRDATWTHREFELIYPPSMDLKQSAWSGMYSRDWELNCAAWAVRFARFRFIAHTDDDAFVCARSMVEILGALPVPTRGLVLGWNRRDAFDNCLVLVSRDVADYFALYYYEKLRPAQIRNGVTYGSGWSASKGDWRAARRGPGGRRRRGRRRRAGRRGLPPLQRPRGAGRADATPNRGLGRDGWRNGTWYDALGVDAATVPARVAATYAPPPAAAGAGRRRRRCPPADPIRCAPSAGATRSAFRADLRPRDRGRRLRRERPAEDALRPLPAVARGHRPRDDWVDKPLNGAPPPPHAPDDEALVVPPAPRPAPAARGRRRRRSATLAPLRAEASSRASAGAAAAASAALSAALNAPSLFPIVVYLHHGRRDVEDDFTRFLDALGVAWLPTGSFADELPADLRDVPLHSFAWIDAAALLEALRPELEERGVGDGRRALVTSAGVQFARATKLDDHFLRGAAPRATCRAGPRGDELGTKRCCGDAAGAVVAVGTEAAGTENLAASSTPRC